MVDTDTEVRLTRFDGEVEGGEATGGKTMKIVAKGDQSNRLTKKSWLTTRKEIASLLFLLVGSNICWIIAYKKMANKNNSPKTSSVVCSLKDQSYEMTPSKNFDWPSHFEDYLDGPNNEEAIDDKSDGTQRKIARQINKFYCDKNNICEVLSSVYQMAWSSYDPPCATIQTWADFIVLSESFPLAQYYKDMVESYIIREGFGAKCFPFLETLEFTSLDMTGTVCSRSNEYAIYSVEWNLQVRTACVVYVPTYWGGTPGYVKTLTNIYDRQMNTHWNNIDSITSNMGF